MICFVGELQSFTKQFTKYDHEYEEQHFQHYGFVL